MKDRKELFIHDVVVGNSDTEYGIVYTNAGRKIANAKEGFSVKINNKIFNKLTEIYDTQIRYADYHRAKGIEHASGIFTINGKKVEFVLYDALLFVFDNSVTDEVINTINKIEKGMLEDKGNTITIRYPIETPFGIVMKSMDAKESNIKEKIYPWLFKFSIDQHNRPFNPYQLGKEWNGQGNLMILHGEPGSGKSKSVMWIGFGLQQATKKHVNVIIINPRTINKLGDMVIDAIDYTSMEYLFVVDDFDKLGGKFVRGENETISNIISLLLQMTDGILPIEHIKFLITSNRKIDEIDSALLRPGRLYRRIALTLRSFKEVAGDKISIPEDVIEEYKQYFDDDFNFYKPLTLAEWKFLVDRIPELKEHIT